MAGINIWAVIVAAVLSFVLGGVWYAAGVFGRAWQREVGLSDEQLKQGSQVKIFGGSFVLSLLGAWVFAMFLGPAPEFGFAVGAGFAAGLAWVAGSFGISYLFEHRSLKLWLINGGYHVVQYTLFGAILGIWH